jgi:formate dehydrogenase iron-sulfur subunit
MKKGSKKIGRRHFLKLLAGAPAYALLGSAGVSSAEIRPYGKLVDTSKCIGCKRCMSACKRWNHLKVDRAVRLTDKETHLSANNWTVVNLRTQSTNRATRTYVKWQCQHCEQPACAGVCPVTAITKLPQGPVVINENKCIGCLYCFQACPYKIPRFDFEKRNARKCTLCNDRVPLLNYMKPACVAACPVGALSFDYRYEIVKKALRRQRQLGGSTYILGLTEAGGTSVLTILPAKPQLMGLVVAPKKVINQGLDKIRITSTGLMAASGLTGLMYMYARKTRDREKKNNNGHDL